MVLDPGLTSIDLLLHKTGRHRFMKIKVPHDSTKVEIRFFVGNDTALKLVAFVQAMLKEGLAQFIHNAGKLAEIVIERSMFSCKCTSVELKAQIAPLLPFTSGYTLVERMPR
jgi:hypothetical protein